MKSQPKSGPRVFCFPGTAILLQALAEARASHYELGEALLQIAVVLSSITLFTRNHKFFLLGLALGITGLIIAGSALLIH